MAVGILFLLVCGSFGWLFVVLARQRRERLRWQAERARIARAQELAARRDTQPRTGNVTPPGL